MPQKSNIWYSCLRQKASQYLTSVKLCKISQTEAGSRKKRIWSNPSILQLSKFYLSRLEPCHVWGKSDWNMQNMSNIQIKILCGCILIHHYFCGNYWCAFQQICFSWCLFCSCLFILQTRFMFYPARCLWWKCKTFDTPIQRLDLYFYFDLYLPYGRNLTLDQNIWKTRLDIP